MISPIKSVNAIFIKKKLLIYLNFCFINFPEIIAINSHVKRNCTSYSQHNKTRVLNVELLLRLTYQKQVFKCQTTSYFQHKEIPDF